MILHRYIYMMVSSYVISILCLVSSSLMHDIHVSNTEIRKTSDQKLEVSIRIFTDDLQNALGLSSGELPENYRGAEVLIKEYIDKVFAIRHQGKLVDMQYEESIGSGDAVWIYLKSKDQITFEQIEIYNAALHELFNDQLNMIKVIGEKKTTILLDKRKTSATLEI